MFSGNVFQGRIFFWGGFFPDTIKRLYNFDLLTFVYCSLSTLRSCKVVCVHSPNILNAPNISTKTRQNGVFGVKNVVENVVAEEKVVSVCTFKYIFHHRLFIFNMI